MSDVLTKAEGRDQATTVGARGVCRLLEDMGYASLTEFTPASGRRIDVMALGRDGELLAVEIKSCLADFRPTGNGPSIWNGAKGSSSLFHRTFRMRCCLQTAGSSSLTPGCRDAAHTATPAVAGRAAEGGYSSFCAHSRTAPRAPARSTGRSLSDRQ